MEKYTTFYLYETILIIHKLSYNIDLRLDTRMMKFAHSCLNHCNSVCKSLLSAKLHCIKSTFAANYKSLSYECKICQDDWFKNKNKKNKNKNTFISEKKCNVIIIFIKYVTYNYFLETAIMGTAANTSATKF